MITTNAHAHFANARSGGASLQHTTLMLALLVFCAALAQATAAAGATGIERGSTGSAARAEARAVSLEDIEPSAPGADTVGSAARAADRFRPMADSVTLSEPTAPRSRGTR